MGGTLFVKLDQQVNSDNEGCELIKIRGTATNDVVRSALLMLNDDPGTTSVLELHYQSNCFRDTDQTCT